MTSLCGRGPGRSLLRNAFSSSTLLPQIVPQINIVSLKIAITFGPACTPVSPVLVKFGTRVMGMGCTHILVNFILPIHCTLQQVQF